MIDLTLDALLVPALEGYTPVIGRKIEYTSKNKGGLSTQQVIENVALPFVKQRAISVESSDVTTVVEYNASLVIHGDNTVISLGNGAASGIQIEIFSAVDSKIIFNNRGAENMFSGNFYKFLWTGTKWRVSDGIMTGNYILRSSERIPVGYLAADGQKVSEDEYPELYAEIGDMYQPAGTDKIKGSFYLPNFKNRVAQGADGNVGAYIEAGLPNITGAIGYPQNGGNPTGAFYYMGISVRDTMSGNNDTYYAGFDASRSSPLYGKSNTVQPLAVCCNYLIKY